MAGKILTFDIQNAIQDALYICFFFYVLVYLFLFYNHRDDNKGLAIMSRHRYPVETCRVFQRTDFAKLKDTLTMPENVDDKVPSEVTSGSANGQEPSASANDGGPVTDISEKPLSRKEKKSAAKTKQSGSNSKVSNGGQSNKATLKTILGEALAYGPALAEHIILDAGLVPSTKVGKDPESSVDDNTLNALMESITRFEDWLVDIISGQRIPEGYILMQNKMAAKKNLTPSEGSSTNQKVCQLLLIGSLCGSECANLLFRFMHKAVTRCYIIMINAKLLSQGTYSYDVPVYRYMMNIVLFC